MQLGQRSDVGRGAPPARLRAPAQRAEPGARRVDQHPVEFPCGKRRFTAVGAQHLHRQTTDVLLDQFRAARVEFDGGDGRALLCGDRREQRGLAAGSGAQIQPAAGVGTDTRRQRQSPGHQLAALVLHQRLPVAQGREPAGVAAGEVDRIGRVATDLAVHRLRQVGGRQDAGAGRQMHRRPGVVGGQRGVQFPGVGAESVGERLGDPARVGVHQRGVADRILSRRRSQLGQPAGLVPAGDLAQHRVDESGSRRIEFDSGLLDGGRDRGVFGDVGAQQLIRAEPQQVQQHGVDLIHRPPGRGGDHDVEQSPGAAGAVGEFGREGGVAAGDAAFAQQSGERQVGVGVSFGDRAQDVERGATGGVELGPARPPGRLRRPVTAVFATLGSTVVSVLTATTLIHDARAWSPRRAPRVQSSASIGFLPGGCT